MDNSKILVDLRVRTFEIDVPHDRVDATLDRLESFFSMPLPSDRDAPEAEQSSASLSEEAGETAHESSEASKSETSRKRAKSSAKPKSYELVELNLTPEQRENFRSDFAVKAPSQQSDMVAVTGFLLKKLTGKSAFTPNEIHSGIKIVNKPTPKNLLAVFGNMKRDGIGDYAEGKVVINSLTEDHADHHMAKKQQKKK